MKNWIESWKQLLPYEQVFRALSLLLSLVVLAFWVLYALQILDVVNASIPLVWIVLIIMGLEGFTDAVYKWRINRGPAIVSLCCGIFCLVCSLIFLILI